jgi:hypothetical protein
MRFHLAVFVGMAVGASACAGLIGLEREGGIAPDLADAAHDGGAGGSPADGPVTNEGGDGAPGGPCADSVCPVLALDFDEPDGSVAFDVSGHGDNATLFGSIDRVAGVQGLAVSLNAEVPPPEIVVPNSDLIDIGGSSMTLALFAFVQNPAAESDETIVMKPWTEGVYNAPYCQFCLEYQVLARAYVLTIGIDDSGNHQPFSVVGPVQTWTHLAWVLGDGTVSGYVDGVLSGSTTTTATITKRHTAIHLGVNATGGEPFTQGRIDSLRLFDRALSADEIKILARR